jgi:hypothetical protein
MLLHGKPASRPPGSLPFYFKIYYGLSGCNSFAAKG